MDGGWGRRRCGDGRQLGGGSAPSRVDNKGPHLIFNGVDVTVTGTPPNTSDGGGISVTGNGSVSVGLGQWGGNVYVEKGSSLTTSFGTQLKNMEPEGHANIYVDGTLNMTTPGGISILTMVPVPIIITGTLGLTE